MNYTIKNYEIPSTTIFFEGKVQRNLGIIYGLTIDQNNYTSIIKVPAGTFKDSTLNSFFNFKQNGNTITPFESNYPQTNSYKETCKLYAIRNKDIIDSELKWSPLTSGWTTNDNLCIWFFTSDAAQQYKNSNPSISSFNTSFIEKDYVIKNLINNNVVFNNNYSMVGCTCFIFDDCPNYLPPVKSFTIPNIEYTELSADYKSGITFYDAAVQNNIGYVYGLQIIDDKAEIIKVPAVRYYDYNQYNTRELFRFNNINGQTFFAKYYPQAKSYTTTCKLFYINKISNKESYNINTRSYTTNKSQASFFFTTNNAKYFINKNQLSDVEVSSINCNIKYLTNDACI